MLRLLPEKAECFVSVFREGALARVGHDVMLRFSRMKLTVAEQPASLHAEFFVDSLEVVGAIKNGRVDAYTLSASDKREIADNARKVLEPRSFPTATFRSSAVEAKGDVLQVVGELTLHGVTRRLVLSTVREGDQALARVLLHQPDYRLKPFKALLGALRIKPDVAIELRVPIDA